MMNKIFVSKTFIFILIIVGFVLYQVSGLWLTLLYLAVIAPGLYLFRKKHLLIDFESNETDKVLVSPVNGKIVSIDHNIYIEELNMNCTQVHIRIGFLDGFGIYLPSSAEVDYLMRHRGHGFFRYFNKFKLNKKNDKRRKWSHTNLKLKNNDGNYYMLSFVRCYLGMSPNLWLKSGDRGLVSACMGVMPFGGTMCLYLPAFFDICTNENTKISAGETMIAAIKG